MKIIFTSLLLTYVAAGNVLSQCSVGGNGVVVTSNITIDGVMSDWTTILNDPDNITYDKSPDADAPVSDVGRDFTRFAFTENVSTLFLYFQRAGSANNSVDLLFYLDVNNNGLMQTNEPVVAISWSGSNGNTQVDMYNYNPKVAAGDPVTGDGMKMPGTLSLRVRLGSLGKGSTNGLSLEVALPFKELYIKGATSNSDSLATTEQFKFHISSINGSIGSVPGSNSINDNFGGCFSGFVTALAINDRDMNIHSKKQVAKNSFTLNNPFYSDLVMRFEIITPESVNIRLYNLRGETIYSQKQLFTKGINTLTVPAAIFPSQGMYLMEVIDDYSNKITKKVLKVS